MNMSFFPVVESFSGQVRWLNERRSVLLAATVLLNACSVGDVSYGQVVNDPSTMAIQRSAMSRFQPLTPGELEQATQEENALLHAPSQPLPLSGKKTVAMPLPPNLQPELDLKTSVETLKTPEKPPAAAENEPIKARAVMVDINSNNLNYDKDHDVYIATGSVHMIISEQNSELFSDKLTYDQNQDLAIAEGHVVIIKAGQKTEGTYAKIDLTRKSALINDTSTIISAVKIKAKQSFVNNNEVQMENGKLIVSGVMYQQFMKNGGLSGLGQNTGKGANQARLRRQYAKKIYQNRDLFSQQLTLDQRQTMQSFQQAPDPNRDNFDDSPERTSKYVIKAKEIEIVRHEDSYDDITLKKPSLYVGKYKLFNLPETDMSYDGESKNIQYLGPDMGGNKAYGGAYLGPGWDFHVGRGSLRVSPIASFGSPGYWSSDGKTGKQVSNGFGLGGIVHYRDADTTADLAYNSHVGTPILFADRRLIGQNTHVMASYNDIYQNGLLGQNERPTYIAQVTDYRVIKDFSRFQLTSFESVGVAKDNYYPNFRQTYFIAATGNKGPQTLGRAQLQLQVQNTAPLVKFGKYANLGFRAQLLTAAYTSSDFVALGRVGPTLNFNLLGNRLQTNMTYTLSHTMGKSPFVFDSYYGGAQNVSMSNLLRVNKFLSIGNIGSYSLNRDNAKNALAVGNIFYLMVGPTDLKATIGWDFVNSRSYIGFNYFPGNNNSVINFEKLRMIQPTNYNQVGAASKF